MIPIHEFLARVRWDPAFGQGRWEIAYVDHARAGLVRVPLGNARARPGVRFGLDVIDDEGLAHTIPYHRIREVWHDGKVIWSRSPPAP